MSEPLLRCVKVTKRYRISFKTLDILKGVNLELNRGDMCYILGRSGSGKSTLLHILGGLDRPTSGKVFIERTRLYSFGDFGMAEIRNKRVGFVFQFYHLLPELTVWQNVMLPGMIARKNVKKKADELLSLVGLADRRRHLPQQLSGGEMQRVALARALVNEPDIVFCDEPTGNLDEENAVMIYALMERLNREAQQTFCIVTHEESFVAGKPNVFRLREGVLTR